MSEEKKGANVTEKNGEAKAAETFGQKVKREIISWFWVILIFLFIQGTIVQARVIPSQSMENTLLVGDHLLVTRFGYDAEIPFTGIHKRLWREPKRQQIVVFRMPGQPDFVKRLIGLPGDTVEIKDGAVWVNGMPLEEPYLVEPHSTRPLRLPAKVEVPEGHYFMMGDNRTNSSDSREWGFVARENIIGLPLLIYMSIDAPTNEAWQPGHLPERFKAYGTAIIEPKRIRFRRIFSAP